MATAASILEVSALQTATIVDALIVLTELEDAATHAAFTGEPDDHALLDLGRLSEACDVAGDVLFNVLNVGANHVQHDRFRQALRHLQQRSEDARNT